MYRITCFILLFFLGIGLGKAQIKITAFSGGYDSIFSGTPVHYQYSWDDPLEEVRDSFKFPLAYHSFGIIWDSMIISDGSVLMISHDNPGASLIVDATGWDLIDKGWEDTIDYPNLSPIIVSSNNDEVEWRDFGFARELDSIHMMPSYGNVIIKCKDFNKVELIYGDIGIMRPDLCFEGFGSFRPSVTFIEANKTTHTWFIYGNPENPSLDSTTTDSAFDHLPVFGQHILLDLNNTKSIKKNTKPSLKLFPNPTTDKITISGPITFAENYFEILSVDGKVLFNGKLATNSVDVSALSSGTYIFKLLDGERAYFARFVKINE